MRQDDPLTVTPPAIVRPAPDIGDIIAEEQLTLLMEEAQAFGRKTVEQAIACGERLIEAKQRFEAKKGKRKGWVKLLGEYGFGPDTAQRLMRKARNKDAINRKMRFIPDAIYDDGQPPPKHESDEGKLVCRDCRVSGKKYSSKCRKCKALNRPIPAPQEEKPLVDEDGVALPENLQPVWLDAQTIRSWNKQLLDFGKSLHGLAERPGCRGIPVDHFVGKLKAFTISMWAFRPGFICPDCSGQACEKCVDGWLPSVVVRNQRKIEKAKEWDEKRARSKDPLPE